MHQTQDVRVLDALLGLRRAAPWPSQVDSKAPWPSPTPPLVGRAPRSGRRWRTGAGGTSA
eukprot:3062139-Pyramimonas_sp.AAC.1